MCLICVKQRKSIQNKQHNYRILINVVTITIKKTIQLAISEVANWIVLIKFIYFLKRNIVIITLMLRLHYCLIRLWSTTINK